MEGSESPKVPAEATEQQMEAQQIPVETASSSAPEMNETNNVETENPAESNEVQPAEKEEESTTQQEQPQTEQSSEVQTNAPYIEESESNPVETEESKKEVQEVSVKAEEPLPMSFDINDVKATIPEVDPDWENWNSSDLAVRCIFCSYGTPDLASFWDHCEKEHHFTREYLRNEKGTLQWFLLDFLGVTQKQWIHLVNYLRSLPESDRLHAFETLFEDTSIWDCYNYTKNTLDNDPLLYLYGDNIFDDFDFGDDERPVFDL